VTLLTLPGVNAEGLIAAGAAGAGAGTDVSPAGAESLANGGKSKGKTESTFVGSSAMTGAASTLKANSI
jgi:hypothetical protein